MRAVIISAILALGVISGAQADSCTELTNQDDINACADQAHKRADGEMQEVYNRVVEGLRGNESGKELLAVAQSDWTTFRASECAFYSSSSAGEAKQPMEYSLCLEAMALRRSAELKTYLACDKGVLRCN